MNVHFLLFCFIFEFAHFSLNFLVIYDLFYVYEMFCLCVCLCNTCVSAEIRREGQIPLELELFMVMSHQVGAGN